MTFSNKAMSLIKEFEGLRLEAYLCPARIWTIGYGETGSRIKQGLTWTEEMADHALRTRLVAISSLIENYVVPILTQNEMDALVSFVYNVGITAFKGSTMLRLINQRQSNNAAEQFTLWNKVHGVPCAGLTRRRAAEKALFLLA